MIFYHFTAHEFIEAIRQEGLTRGFLFYGYDPDDRVDEVVWLTTDKESDGHGLADGEPMPNHVAGHPIRPTTFLDKRAIRITVVWPKSKVTYFPSWARKRLGPEWLDALVKTGGGADKASTWYFSRKPIPPDAFRSIEILR